MPSTVLLLACAYGALGSLPRPQRSERPAPVARNLPPDQITAQAAKLPASLSKGVNGADTLTILAYPDENQVYAALSHPGESTTTIKYLGDFHSEDECLDACMSFPTRCYSYTYHTKSVGGEWALGCYGITSPRWSPTTDAGVNSGWIEWPCESDSDCSLNGICNIDNGVCTCRPQWSGNRCQYLNLPPATHSNGYQQVDDGEPTSSWGGSVLQDDDGLWHMWVSEMINHCGIDAWNTNSHIIHATSNSAEGPFERQEETWGVFSHEPNVVRAPTGEYVMLFTMNVPSPIPPCNCSDGTTGPDDCPDESAAQAKGRRGLLSTDSSFLSYATDPNGPWSEPVSVWPDWYGSDTNIAISINDDASFVGLWRNWDIKGSRTYLANGTDWKDPNTWNQYPVDLWPDLGAKGTEDYFLYKDQDGYLHAVTHHMYGLPAPDNMEGWWREAAGAHAYSLDGTSWTFGGLAWGNLSTLGNDMRFTDGDTQHFSRRERPHLVLTGAKDPTGPPLYLVTSAQYTSGDEVFDNEDGTYTTVAPITQDVDHPPLPADPVGFYDAADPAMLRFQGAYYEFDNDGLTMSSTDLSTWSPRRPFLSRSPAWADAGSLGGAPGIIALSDSSFVLYFQAVLAGCHGEPCTCIGAATSQSPSQPFAPAEEPLVCMPELRYVVDGSPKLFGEKLYLYWKSTGFDTLDAPSQLWVQELDPNTGLAFQPGSSPINLLNQTESWEARQGIGCIEAPSMLGAAPQQQARADGTYTLFYSGGAWDEDWYALGYASCNSPVGPCKKVTTDSNGGPWLQSYNNTQGPGSCETFYDASGAPWITFHGWGPDVGYPQGQRMLRIYPFSALPPVQGLPMATDTTAEKEQALLAASFVF